MRGRMRTRLVYGKAFEGLGRVPHFLNMSGGRSSAAMALSLAENGELDAGRGDVVLFCNTAAEHPDTYVFADRVSSELEGMGFPVFWLEFCTVEMERRGRWSRQPWWRIVNRRPYDEVGNPEGYRQDGFVFEELMSFKLAVPSMQQRMCTQNMKVETAARFYQEWLCRTERTLGGGHFGERRQDAAERAAVYRGELSSEEAETMFDVAYNRSGTGVRSQRWSDYTSADISGWAVGEPRKIDLMKEGEYVKILGLRADEPSRVARILDRILFDRSCTDSKYPPGEHLLVPLHDAGLTKKDVMDFWSGRSYDLEAPFWAGNCTFCFMKTSKGLQIGAAMEQDAPTLGEGDTPISWWIEVENRYARRAARGDAVFGFLGKDGPSYESVIVEGGTQPSLLEEDIYADIPCDCTD